MWGNTVKVSIVVNAFCEAGIYPVDFKAIRKTKLVPLTLYKSESLLSKIIINYYDLSKEMTWLN